MKNRIIIPCMFILSGYANAEITLPYLVTDGMVTQRNETIPIWGLASANTKLTVNFDGKAQTVISTDSGKWQVNFSAKPAGGPYKITINGDEQNITINDVWIGDVWVCSGQSNMEWTLDRVNNAEHELANATDTQIRHFKVPRSWAASPQQSLAGGTWQVSSPEAAAEFTGVGYFFAKTLREHVDVPIGLISANWGGSNIESWMSASTLGQTEQQAMQHIQKIVDNEKIGQATTIEKLKIWPNALGDNFRNANADWSAFDLNESDWLDIKAPILWESAGYIDVDGVAWYRKRFTLTEKQIAEDLTLHLAKIDDNDITWVNGIKVGATNAYDLKRIYTVAQSILKVGENSIAIRVEDNGGGGGIYSDPDQLFFENSTIKKSLAGTWKYKIDKAVVSVSNNRNHTPTALYNKMMKPLFNIPVKGVIWYQGESNAGNAKQAYNYRHQFKELITDWRTQWNKPSLPFFWVQLANFNTHADTETESPWAIVRDSQSAALALPNTGQAITIDVGNPTDIHPRNKQSVGKRLALNALNKVYQKDNINARGPIFRSFTSHGDKLVLAMKVDGQLTTSNLTSNKVNGFEIAGVDKLFVPADARLSGNKIIVSNSKVTNPVAVRYAWNDNPVNVNLFDQQGLPAEPFRTDKWLEQTFE